MAVVVAAFQVEVMMQREAAHKATLDYERETQQTLRAENTSLRERLQEAANAIRCESRHAHWHSAGAVGGAGSPAPLAGELAGCWAVCHVLPGQNSCIVVACPSSTVSSISCGAAAAAHSTEGREG